MGRLDGKTALVTGAGRGIGRGIASRLAAEGARVVINYGHSAEAAESLRQEILTSGGQALTAQADVSDIASIRSMFETLKGQIDGLDILVNNAGRGSGGMPTTATMTPEAYDALFALNARGVFFTTQAALPLLRDGGRIINISSTTTLVRMAGLGVYAASKAAVEAFTRSWAAEFAPRRITVNSILPGIVDTDLLVDLPPEIKARSAASVPLGRMGQPDDIAGVVAFLASDDGRWMTGQNLVAAGGSH
ncbi:MAG: glucose 1-dehydrogenase [Phenylobacterium sp.]|nr:glucose 1-dehydrogenase [Phenylobacterium sp.]